MSENTCVCCGEIIPEGIQVCPNCVSAGDRKQLHWFESVDRALHDGRGWALDSDICVDFPSAQKAIFAGRKMIRTTIPCVVTTYLFQLGYRIFLHFDSGRIRELKFGSDGGVRYGDNLESMLLAGWFGKLGGEE